MSRESNFYPKLRHFIETKFKKKSMALEVKATTHPYLFFSVVREHQIQALLAARLMSLTYKPPDDSRGYKPCDFLHLAQVGAYVVIKYPKEFHFIDIVDFLAERDMSDRQSLTVERAREIAKYSGK